MTDGDLLLRIAATLRQEIAPAIEDEYAKTQAFMAAVVLQKLSQQIALAPEHERANEKDLDALIVDLNAMASPAPIAVGQAIADLARSRDPTALCRLVEALYANRAALDEHRFAQLLARLRLTLRSSIERRMEYAE